MKASVHVANSVEDDSFRTFSIDQGSRFFLLRQVMCFCAMALVTVGLVMATLPMNFVLLLMTYRFY